MTKAKTEYFLGGISPEGFTTHFNDIIKEKGVFTYILKGGAGTGKSSLMKKVASAFENKDTITCFYCASDPFSLDAILLENAKVIIVDGTSPHVFDPQYPGVSQIIVNLGDFWDKYKLQSESDKIISVIDENQRWHKRCRNFVTALSSLFSDTYTISQEAILYDKLENFTDRFAKKVLTKKKTDTGKTSFCQLSALTPQGYKTLYSTLKNYNDIYLLNDMYYSGSDTFLRDFATTATNFGYDIIISECTLISGKMYEHLLIPELSLALITSDPLNNTTAEKAKPVNFMRFYDKEIIKQKKVRLSFNKKACSDLVAEAVNALIKAKDVHDDIEDFYIDSMDFSGNDKIAEQIINEINKR